MIDTNLTSAFICSHAAHPHMKKAGGGKIINIGSMMSIFAAGFAPAYAASKGGIVQFGRACATAWAKDNIQVNAVLPGWIDTDLTKNARREVDGLHERVLGRTPAAAGAIRRTFPALRCFLAARRRISSPARRSRSTVGSRCRGNAGLILRRAEGPSRRMARALGHPSRRHASMAPQDETESRLRFS